METIQLGAEEAIRSWGSTLTSAIAGKRVEILRHGKPVAVLIGLEHENLEGEAAEAPNTAIGPLK